MALLEVKNAGFSYGSREIFKNVELQVEAGQILCIFGPNGCGKSTLLECILKLLKLEKGNISVDGIPTDGLKPKELAKYIAYVPQIHEKSFPYSVFDFVLMGRAAYTGTLSSPGEGDLRIAEEALESLGISGFKNRPYTQLSGGELQLVMIARALAQMTPLIIMDEPTSHLDFKNDIAILETIAGLVKKKNIAVVMTSHFPNQGFFFEYLGLSVKVLLMGENTLMTGKPSEVFTEENMKNVFRMESRVITCPSGDDRVLRQIVSLCSKVL